METHPDYQTIRLEMDDGVATVTLNRPEKKNALNPALNEEVVSVLDRLRYDPAAQVLVITGAGDSFCAGMDLKECFQDLQDNPIEWDRMQNMAQEWRGEKLRMFPKPTIAAVNGCASAAGSPSSRPVIWPSPPRRRCSGFRRSTSAASPPARWRSRRGVHAPA